MTASSRDSAPSSMAGLFLLLLLPAVLAQRSAIPTIPTPALFDPLTQPECTKKEHPKVSIQALSPWISTFSHPGVRDYSQLTLDLTRNELIVGARNNLFRLDLSNMSLIQATEWAPDEETRRSCQSKGKTEIECQNYIRVLLVNKTEVMTCGTNAFQPLLFLRPDPSARPLCSTVVSSAWEGLCFQGQILELSIGNDRFHRSGAVRNLCNQPGECCCKDPGGLEHCQLWKLRERRGPSPERVPIVPPSRAGGEPLKTQLKYNSPNASR